MSPLSLTEYEMNVAISYCIATTSPKTKVFREVDFYKQKGKETI